MSQKLSLETKRLYERAVASQTIRLEEYGPPLRELIRYLRLHPEQVSPLERVVLANFGPTGTIYHYEFLAHLVHEFRFERIRDRCVHAVSAVATTGADSRYQRYCRQLLEAYHDEWEDSSLLWENCS